MLEKKDFQKIGEVVDEKIDSLAVIIQEGFQGAKKDTDKRFDSVDKQFKELREGQERIELRLDNVAYRFELVQLEERVKRVEAKLGLKSA